MITTKRKITSRTLCPQCRICYIAGFLFVVILSATLYYEIIKAKEAFMMINGTYSIMLKTPMGVKKSNSTLWEEALAA